MTFDKSKYDIEYRKNKLKRIPLDIPKDKYEQIKNHAYCRGETINGFIKRCIDSTMKQDNERQP